MIQVDSPRQISFPPETLPVHDAEDFPIAEDIITSPRTILDAQQPLGLKPWMEAFIKTAPGVPVDTLSHAEPHLAVTTHLVWDVNKIDFENKILSATATYSYRNKLETDRLMLDVKDLDIKSVTLDGEDVPYEIVKGPQGNPDKFDGLKITIPSHKKSGQVSIEYTTSPKSSGLFWIDPAYTTGKKHPLLYTQFEANEGASALPGQHSPQVRLTWHVNVKTGSEELIALSSAKNNPKNRTLDGQYNGLYMDRKIPLYLLCLEVGHMEYSAYDERCGIYTEPETMEKAKSAFIDMPKYIACAEKIFGPYKWGRYEASILGNAYPYNAMEHACKSTFGAVCMGKPEVIAHEITHSWLGNDITNATWFEFFFNEGFTVFGETLIMTEMLGSEYAALMMIGRLKEMEKAMNEYRDTRPGLLSLVSTDVEFTRIPYAKGALFFFMLREAIGHTEFAQFVKDYMNVFYQGSMASERFLAFLKEWLKHEMNNDDFETFKQKHQIDEWLHGQEIPDNRPIFVSKLLDAIQEEAQSVLSGNSVNVELYQQWTEQVKSVFLGELEGKITREQLIELEKALNPTDDISLIMRSSWSQIFATAGYYTEKTEKFIVNFIVERNSKHLANLISATLCKTPEGRHVAEEILRQGEDRLFEVTRAVIEANIQKNMS